MKPSLIISSVFLLFTTFASAWGTEDHEIFRLRDEVEASEGEGATFYSFLGVKPSASQADLNAAYKRKSRQIHPDKFKATFTASFRKEQEKARQGQKPGSWVIKEPSDSQLKAARKEATLRFARLGVVVKMLRGESRARYDHFLQNGFPTWRGTGYYYARFRPGLGSVIATLFIFVGGGIHYGVLLMNWSRQKKFVGRYIREARKAAWGNTAGLAGIADIGKTTATSNSNPEDLGMESLNRKERREAEKEKKRQKKGRMPSVDRGEESRNSEIGDRAALKKRVTAENGKVLIVNAVGTVWLEGEDDDGNKTEYLLDERDFVKPRITDTMLFSVPRWAYREVANRASAKTQPVLTTGVDESKFADDSGYDSEEPKPKSRQRKQKARGRQ